MSTTVPCVTLNNGVELPALGLGVFQTPPDETRDAVRAALDAGYRHIDTAAAYGNEREVGDAVRASGLDRSDVFLETKIWISDYGRLRRDAARVPEERRKARRGADRPADPPPGPTQRL
jgi:2,5-diketo-D-gluconate reductase A